MAYRASHIKKKKKLRVVVAVICFVLLFAIANGGMWLVYRNRVLPHYELGRKSIGNMTYTHLSSLQTTGILPATIELTSGTAHITQAPSELGLRVAMPATIQALRTSHTWFPLLNLVMHRQAPLVVTLQQTQLTQAIAQFGHSFTVPAQPDHIVLRNDQFVIQPSSTGRGINVSALGAALARIAQQGKTTLMVPEMTLTASEHDSTLQDQVAQLNKALTIQLGFSYGGKVIHPSKSDITGWYVASGVTMSPSDDRIATYINHLATQLGTTSANPADMAVAVNYVLGKNLPRTFNITPANGSQVRTYCTSVLDESDSYLNDLIGKLAATYNDTRGWNNSGKIAFEHVTSGCQYTVWISAASQMTTFGSICDDYYNCQVGTNVILNYDRWTTATDPWNKTDGSLEDYRTLMIDHETGHRLGFYDNPTCPAQGQPAPVMMQQSIDLKGCVFNIWPLQSEFSALDSMLGLSTINTVTASE